MADIEVRFLGDAIDEITVPEPARLIQGAADRAQEMARTGAAAINKTIGDRDQLRFGLEEKLERYLSNYMSAFPLYFGLKKSNPIQHLTGISHRLNTLSKRLDKGILIKVRPNSGEHCGNCRPRTNAYQSMGSATNPRTFNLCPDWFNEDFSLDDRAAIMCHEMCHAIGNWFGTGDQKFDDGDKVSTESEAREFAVVDPADASVNPENYEHFLTYLSQPTRFIGRSGWRKVKRNMDAAILTRRGDAAFVYGKKVLIFDFDEAKVTRTAEIGTTIWNGLPAGPDAAIIHPNGKSYFFKGKKYYRANIDTGVIEKTGRIGTSGWRGVPTHVDAALMHPSNGKAYFFKGINYHRYDFAKRDVDKKGFIGRDGWTGLRGMFDAALVHPENGLGYFFVGEAYYRYEFGEGALPA